MPTLTTPATRRMPRAPSAPPPARRRGTCARTVLRVRGGTTPFIALRTAGFSTAFLRRGATICASLPLLPPLPGGEIRRAPRLVAWPLLLRLPLRLGALLLPRGACAPLPLLFPLLPSPSPTTLPSTSSPGIVRLSGPFPPGATPEPTRCLFAGRSLWPTSPIWVLALAMCCACPFRYNMLSPQADLGRYFTHGTTSVMRRCRPGQRRMFCSWVWGGAHFSFLPSLPFSCTHQPPILDSLLARRPSERLWLRRAPTVIFRSSCPLTRGLHSYSVRLPTLPSVCPLDVSEGC